MLFSIHQFSSGIKNPSQNQKGDWRSGGFDKEIANESYSVPEEIQNAVQTTLKSGWRGFGIRDANPPKLGDIALIARDLGNYCVLAVANIQGDDAMRSFVTYRYFWLDKRPFQNQQDFDGIATLLWYWGEKGKPQFNIGELVSNSNSYTKSWDKLEQSFLFVHRQQHLQRIQTLLANITQGNQPLLYEAEQIKGKLSPEEVHCLAIQYSSVNNCPIGWAWNVRSLENPNHLNVIYCADAEAFNWFRNQFPSSHPAPTPVPTSSGQGGAIVYVSHSRETGNSPHPQRCLQKFCGNFEPQDVLCLMNIYQEHKEAIGKFVQNQHIDSFMNEPNPKTHLITYATLITALVPHRYQQIFDKLMRLNKHEKKVALKFLRNLKGMTKKEQSCSNHPDFSSFYGVLSCLQDILSDSLETKPLSFNQYIQYISHFPELIRSRFLQLIFFFLLLSVVFGLMHKGILARLRSINPGNTGSLSPSAATPPTPGSLTDLLEKYDRQYQAVKLLEKNKPEIEAGNSLKISENDLEEYNKKIVNELDKNKSLFETHLKSDDSKIVQNARKNVIYTELKTLTTLASEQVNLPHLNPAPQKPDTGNGDLTKNVNMLQKALKRGKYYIIGQEDSDPPGTFGEATNFAVKSAQKKGDFSEREIDGVVGKRTWQILRGRLEDEQVEMVYQTLQQHLSQSNPTYNIVTEIKKCRDENKDAKALHFGSCVETIPNQSSTPATDNK